MKLETYLSYSSLFSGVEAGDNVRMLDCLKNGVIKVKKNDVIVTAGAPQVAAGLLVYGQAHVYARDRSGTDKYEETLHTGDCFGLENAFQSLMEQEDAPVRWTHSVVASKDCQVAFLDAQRMLNPCEKDCRCHRVMIHNLIKILSGALCRQNRRIALLTVKNMRGRIAGYLLQRMEEEKEDPTMVFLPFNRNRMAAYLDVSRPSMSRELACMKEEGILDYYLDTIQILDMEKLLELAGKTSRLNREESV